MGQSSNDVFPSAVHLAALDEATNTLLPALEQLEDSFAAKAEAFKDIVKSGRTHLMDAVPVTLGQEFAGYAAQVRLGRRRVENALPQVAQIPLGGTATGTGLNTHPEFAAKVREKLSADTGLTISAPEDPFEAQGNRDALVELSGALKVVAVSLTKIAGDIALMGSGPRSGIGELFLPELQKGSSIMPGKVNPVIPEVVLQVGAQVIGNDTAITVGGLQGQFELNVRIPLMARNLLQSIQILSSASVLFADKCVDGIEANLEGCERSAEGTLAVATALNPFIGYDRAAEIVKDASKSGPHAARGRARARRRRGDARQGAGSAQDRRGFVCLISLPSTDSSTPRRARRRGSRSTARSRCSCREAPWPYYARPRLGADDEQFTVEAVNGARARLRELGQPETFEWVHETAPSLIGAIRETGLDVLEVPLLVLDRSLWRPPDRPPSVALRRLDPDDPALAGVAGRRRGRLRRAGHRGRAPRAGRSATRSTLAPRLVEHMRPAAAHGPERDRRGRDAVRPGRHRHAAAGRRRGRDRRRRDAARRPPPGPRRRGHRRAGRDRVAERHRDRVPVRGQRRDRPRLRAARLPPRRHGVLPALTRQAPFGR